MTGKAMRRMVSHTLARRIISLIVAGSLVTFWIMLSRTDRVIEQLLLDQAKRQAQVFLLGVKAELLQMNDPRDPDSLQLLVDRAMEQSRNIHAFTPLYIYIFDRQGNTLAHSLPTSHYPKKKISGHYAAIFEHGKGYLGDEIEYIDAPFSKEPIPKADIIEAIWLDGHPELALEIEINLTDTLITIRTLASRYNQEIFAIVIVSAVLILLFIWWVLHRWLLSPIELMAAITQKIAKGEFHDRVKLRRRRDELGTLASSINEMADSIEELFDEQEEAHIQMLQSLAKALEAKDAYTAGHSERVASYSVKLGKQIKLPPRQLQLLEQGALLHDLGKIGVADAILNKPSRLNEHEYEIIKTHPTMTANIMRPLARFKEFVEIAAWHHERWDGHGYPDQLKGEAIPLLARIVSIADTWDAMTGDRSYRKGSSTEEAIATLEREHHSGQWDPTLLSVFISMVKEEHTVREEIESDMFSHSGFELQ